VVLPHPWVGIGFRPPPASEPTAEPRTSLCQSRDISPQHGGPPRPPAPRRAVVRRLHLDSHAVQIRRLAPQVPEARLRIDRPAHRALERLLGRKLAPEAVPVVAQPATQGPELARPERLLA